MCTTKTCQHVYRPKNSLIQVATLIHTFSVSFNIIVSTAAASADDLYVASKVRIATAVSIFTDEKSPWSSCYQDFMYIKMDMSKIDLN